MKDIIRDLANKDQHNLKLRFQVGLGIILFCFCLFTTTIIYHFQKNLLEEEALRQTELVTAALESTRGYIREVLRPRMYEEFGEDHFIIEAMSTSYITRVIMDRFEEKIPFFKYRRVAIGARNSSFEANAAEQKMIGYFRENPDAHEWHGMTRMDSVRYYTLYRPVVFKTSCLHCHGKPDDAPAAINESYGTTQGFYREANEVAGLFSISIPLEVSLDQIRGTSFRMFGIVLILALLLYGTIWLFFHQLIITNLRDLVTLFRTSMDDSSATSLPKELKGHREELEELFHSARTLISSLQDKRSQLVEYADNLEEMVAERTEALNLSENQLRAQVKKRNRELTLHTTLTGLITRTDTLQTILHQVLNEVLQVIPANGAGIYLYNDKSDNFVLQCSKQAPMLSDSIEPEFTCKSKQCDQAPDTHSGSCDHLQISVSENENSLNIRIPLCCRNRLQGIMVITELPFAGLNDALQDLLLSIGQQIGMTIESLQNMQNLRQSTELLQSVFDGISDPLILLAPDGTLKMVNQAFLLRNNLHLDEALGVTVDMLSLPQQCLFSNLALDVDLSAKKPHTEEIQLDDGSIFDVYFYPILNTDDSVRAIIGFAKDVTIVKATERRIQQTQKLVAVGQLAAGVAHEINNPLGVILCYTDIIKENNRDNEEIIADITTIERHAGNCRRIVADLLDFARSKESRIDKQEASVNNTIKDVLAMLRPQFLKNQINLDCDLDPDLPTCFMDSRRMQQVFLNLIMNAEQAIGSQGNISISTRAESNTITVEIKDDGPGISKEMIDKIFDPFFSTKEPGQGTGLGLSVSYGIVREHDGEIKVQSTPNRGSRFTVTIPVAEENFNND
ncbi:MAG: DUF3365 domain-containing protein [Proteobacteria bacterium]|nr:DUF3365 domain-containing protein [Pseudomonadota bacterium]